uniref:DUF5681 domain-containing protein n=1 Tax=Desulfovibrio sp. U5L TaxID=596152 RepID=I2PZY3_9BACT
MTDTPLPKQQKQRGRPFKPGESGNPKGRTPGTRCKATMAAQALLDGEAETLTRKAVELALEGDLVALRLCMERIVPPRKDSPVKVNFPVLRTASDLPKAMSVILAAVSAGEVTPSEAQALGGLVEAFRKSLDLAELELLISALEESTKEKKL